MKIVKGFKDLNKSKQLHAKNTLLENQILKEILDNIHEGIMVTDTQGKVIFYNTPLEMIEGTNKDDIIGKQLLDLYPVSNKYSSTFTVMKTEKPLIEKEHCYLTPNKRLVNIIYSTLPVYINKKLAAVYCIIRDVTKMSDFLARSLEFYRKLCESDTKSNNNGTSFTLDDVITANLKMLNVIITARESACHSSNILIYGETGTGKELIAQGIHNASLNSNGPFIAVNCAALPSNLIESLLFGSVKGAFTGAENSPGLFEQADKGTIFLDEINSMDIYLQSKFLRVIQDKYVRRIGGKQNIKINCRIISAINKNPLNEIEQDHLRPDLFYRLSTVYLQVPPLRERKEDILLLANLFINRYNYTYGKTVETVSKELLKLLQEYDWPGNVRELDNFIESSLININPKTKVLTIDNVSDFFRIRLLDNKSISLQYPTDTTKTLPEILEEVEKKIIIQALEKNDHNISQTARELGILRQALHYKINKFNIKVK